MSDIEECCGSGCTNCVLDKTSNFLTRQNLDRNNVLQKEYRNFRVIKIELCTSSVYKFVFKFAEEKKDNDALMVPGGSYLMLRANKVFDQRKNKIFEPFQLEATKYQSGSNPKMEPRIIERHDKDTEDIYVSRPYTPIEVKENEFEFTVLIKLEPFGKMSQYLQTLHPGDLTEWKGVYTKINFNSHAYSRIISFCHGVAVTTIYSYAKELLAIDDLDTTLTAYVCFKDQTSILLRDELVNLNCYWNFKSAIFLSNETNTVAMRFNETIILGRINKEQITKAINTTEASDCDLIKKTLFLVCGTSQFTSTIKTFLSELGYDQIEIL